MSGDCCNRIDFDGNSQRYQRILWLVIAINASMFCVEMTMALMANSKALMADSLDFLSDSATYTLSLLVIGRSTVTRANASLVKALSLAVIGLWVFCSSIYAWFSNHDPLATPMVGTAIAALVANLICLFLLLQFRDGDSNVRSVWLCTRNDAAGNVSVAAAAILIANTGWTWPDLVVAMLMSALFLSASWQITLQARSELAQVP